MNKKVIFYLINFFVFFKAAPVYAEIADETGYNLWLRYERVADADHLATYSRHATEIVLLDKSPVFTVIESELKMGLAVLFGKEVSVSESVTQDGAILVANRKQGAMLAQHGVSLPAKEQGYVIQTIEYNGRKITVIASNTDIGALYGTYGFLRLLQTQNDISKIAITSEPKVNLRLLNHWDNLDGGIERGYAGRTLWKWKELPGKVDDRLIDYARYNASVGINGAVLNNVNDIRNNHVILESEYIDKIKAIADAWRPYGVRVYLNAYFASPKLVGPNKLETADPLDPRVQKWWKDKTDEIYAKIPDFGGYLVKANSEGQPGPQDYGRTHADGANMLARALGDRGVVFWRAFVYANLKDPDRAKHAYIEFKGLDGKFLPNVFVQSKNGAIDFQPREPVSPLFGALPKTNVAMEFQVTQEYLGQGKQLVYLAPLYKEVLDFDTYAYGKGTTVGKIIDGSASDNDDIVFERTAVAGVANTGSDINWCGHHFAQSNWYAFGRLAWDYSLSSEELATEWVRMTWSNKDAVVQTIKDMMMGSREACVNYQTPLGLYHMMGRGHYIPAPERNIRYIKASKDGIGVDRTSNGTKYVEQYFPNNRDMFNNIDTCPEVYLMWYHHVKWDHRLKSGRTMWEELNYKYNDGVEYVSRMREQWNSLKSEIDARRFGEVSAKLAIQEADAGVWRDHCLRYFSAWKSGDPQSFTDK